MTYQAALVASQLPITTWALPVYDSGRIRGSYFWSGYRKVHAGVTMLYFSVAFVARNALKLLSFVYSHTVGFVVTPILDRTIYPKSPITGERYIRLVSRRLESQIGYVLHALITMGMTVASDESSRDVKGVFQAMVDNNKETLNPEGSFPFPYEVQVIEDREINAFCVAGGRMVVFTGIMKRIQAAAQAQSDIEIPLPNGAVVTIGTGAVTRDDMLKALLGHEMTHAACSDTLVQLAAKALLSLAAGLGLWYLQRRLLERAKKREGTPTVTTGVQGADLLLRLVSWISKKLRNLGGLLQSRACEYRADVVGQAMAMQAGASPFAALALQKMLQGTHTGASRALHHYGEFLFTHPSSQHRMQALLAALWATHSDVLQGKVTVKGYDSKNPLYDPDTSSPGVRWANRFCQAFTTAS